MQQLATQYVDFNLFPSSLRSPSGDGKSGRGATSAFPASTWGAAGRIFQSGPEVNMGPHAINTPLTRKSIPVNHHHFVYLCVQ